MFPVEGWARIECGKEYPPIVVGTKVMKLATIGHGYHGFSTSRGLWAVLLWCFDLGSPLNLSYAALGTA